VKRIVKVGPRRTPDGYFIAVAPPEAKSYLNDFSNIEVEEMGAEVIIKSRSRSTLKKIILELKSKGFYIEGHL